MGNWAGFLRGMVRTDDRTSAFRSERKAVQAATARSPVDTRFHADMRHLAARHDGVLLGHAAEAKHVEVRIPWHDVVGSGHALVLGGSGAGKTRAVGGVVRSILARTLAGAPPCSLAILDHKSEFTELARLLVAEALEAAPEPRAKAMLDDLVVLNPFSTSALVPLQILAPEPGVAPEVQAFEVASVVNRLGGAELGVRQDSYLFHLLLLGIVKGMSLPEVTRLLSDPVELRSAASDCPSLEVREFFAGAGQKDRLNAASIEGVRARLHRLLRLPTTRAMLGGKTSVSFGQLLKNPLTLIDLGSPPLGCEDIGRFWAGLVTLKLTRAIFERKPGDAKRPVALMVDEWQEGLAAGGDIAEHYERVLAMARSRGVSLWLISQSLAGAAKVAPSLPKIVATNTNVQLLFRSSPEDARGLSHILPVTGRRPREAPSPWERRDASPFLTRSEELQLLVNEASALPDRNFWFWNRKRPYPAVLARACDVDVRNSLPRNPTTRRRLEDGALSVPLRVLEAQARGDFDFRPLPGVKIQNDVATGIAGAGPNAFPARKPKPLT